MVNPLVIFLIEVVLLETAATIISIVTSILFDDLIELLFHLPFVFLFDVCLLPLKLENAVLIDLKSISLVIIGLIVAELAYFQN